MKAQSARPALLFACSGPACKHLLTALSFVIVIALFSLAQERGHSAKPAG